MPDQALRRVAFLSMDSLTDFVCYDDLLIEPLRALGWEVETVSWRSIDVDWDRYEAVVIRSCWDYFLDSAAFHAVLDRINESSAQLENPINLVRWNLHKSYLRDLERQGIPIVPTRFGAAGETLDMPALFDEAGVEELIIKPAISANAVHTYRLDRQTATAKKEELDLVFQNRDWMAQPFLPSVVNEGEYSLFFFGDSYSHTILKQPKAADFRVQEEHGGQLLAVEPDSRLLQQAEEVMAVIRPRPLYARVDFVSDAGMPGATGDYWLMELELIEPSLYFNLNADSPALFAHEFDRWMEGPSAEGQAYDGGSDSVEVDEEEDETTGEVPPDDPPIWYW